MAHGYGVTGPAHDVDERVDVGVRRRDEQHGPFTRCVRALLRHDRGSIERVRVGVLLVGNPHAGDGRRLAVALVARGRSDFCSSRRAAAASAPEALPAASVTTFFDSVGSRWIAAPSQYVRRKATVTGVEPRGAGGTYERLRIARSIESPTLTKYELGMTVR